MTENESIKQAIRCVVGACDETCPHYWLDGVCHGYEEVAKGLEKVLEEIQQYRAIGTVEECRTAYGRGYNQSTIDMAEEIQKAREYGYAKAIEEFASALTNKDNMLEHDIDEIMTSFHSYDLACNYFREYVDYVAEQLKGGAE